MPGLDFYLEAFGELQTERPIGMAAGQIPWYSVLIYAEHHGVDDPDEFDRFLKLIRAMEMVKMQHEKEKAAND